MWFDINVDMYTWNKQNIPVLQVRGPPPPLLPPPPSPPSSFPPLPTVYIVSGNLLVTAESVLADGETGVGSVGRPSVVKKHSSP